MLDTIVKPQERLTVWRNFKKQNLDTNKILRYISSNKTIDRTFDFYTTKYWPTGWEIVSEKMFCHSGKAILLHETLVHMGKINPKDTHWFVADNFEFIDSRDEFLEIVEYGRDDHNITMTISKEMFLKIISKYNETYKEEE